MDFAELSKWLPRIEKELSRDYARVSRLYPRFAPWTAKLEEFALRGGKRFRALLVLAGYHIASHRSPADALGAAAALEHFQSWMLVHDDIIDHAETRRGGPALYRALAREHTEAARPGDPDTYGVGMGITLGDLEEAFTVGALLATRAPMPRRIAVLAEFNRMTRDTAYGQLLDVDCGARPAREVSGEDVLTVHRLKTSVYTVSAPLRIGAILGGARPSLLGDLGAIGTDLGVAFQLRDDVLGAGFDEGRSGKSANDLAEGKRTLLVVYAYAHSDGPGQAALDAALGRADATPQEFDRARRVIRESGSLAYSEKRIAELAGRAGRRIARARGLREGDRALLFEVSDRLTRRER